MKAYVFPGQGAQFSGMGKDLFDTNPIAKELFLKADEILGFEIHKTMFYGTDEELKQTKITQPAIFLHSTILATCLGDSFAPDMVAGHSLGGYLVGKYALKYPKHVQGLVLISPAGIQERPPATEILQDVELDWRIRLMKGLWQCNVTPQSLIRIAGMRGPQFIDTAIKKRFSERWQGEEAKLIGDYMYHITAAPGNGEYCLNALLEPIFLNNDVDQTSNHPTKRRVRSGVFARLP